MLGGSSEVPNEQVPGNVRHQVQQLYTSEPWDVSTFTMFIIRVSGLPQCSRIQHASMPVFWLINKDCFWSCVNWQMRFWLFFGFNWSINIWKRKTYMLPRTAWSWPAWEGVGSLNNLAAHAYDSFLPSANSWPIFTLLKVEHPPQPKFFKPHAKEIQTVCQVNKTADIE